MDKAAIDRWIDDARDARLDDGRIAELAHLLAGSGALLPATGPTADLASTGGPGSLSTLIAPLALASYGLKVPKLGVPGRPAGGVDVLRQIPGYSTRFDESGAMKVLQDCGYPRELSPETRNLIVRGYVDQQKAAFFETAGAGAKNKPVPYELFMQLQLLAGINKRWQDDRIAEIERRLGL